MSFSKDTKNRPLSIPNANEKRNVSISMHHNATTKKSCNITSKNDKDMIYKIQNRV